jgi:predicted methyltransferase
VEPLAGRPRGQEHADCIEGGGCSGCPSPYPGDGEWTRRFSDIVGSEGRIYSFVPAEVADFKNDPVGRMQTFAKEPGRENVEAVSADLVAIPEVTQPADVLWRHCHI